MSGEILDKLGPFLKVALGKNVGYSYYAVDQSRPNVAPRYGHYGYAVRPYDKSVLQMADKISPPSKVAHYWFHGVEQSPFKRMEIMSMSKTITAAAAILLVEYGKDNGALEMGVREDLEGGLCSPIMPFLPEHWDKGEGVEKITFRDLLTHKSKLADYVKPDTPATGHLRSGGLYENIEASIRDGRATLETYKNVNYGLFRILIPHILRREALKIIGQKVANKTFGQKFYELTLSYYYIDYVKSHVLGPAGLGTVSVVVPRKNDDPPRTRYYQLVDDKVSTSKGDFPDSVFAVGASDWKLSSKEYVQFICALTNGAIAPQPLLWDKMYQDRLGVVRFGDNETFAGHDGKGDNLQTGWILVPRAPRKGIVAAVEINSLDVTGGAGNDSPPILDLLAQAFDFPTL